MRRQKSQQTSRKLSGPDRNPPRIGTLFIVGTPIGSPEDLTLRARTILGQVSIVAAETPLATRTLLDYHKIAANITGYRRGDEEQIAVLLDRLSAGHDIALVSDSGMPGIYDPGRLLIPAARARGHRVTVIPGPSALTAAAALSGHSADRLLFLGRLPQNADELDRLFKELSRETGTTVMFAPASQVRRILERIQRILPKRTLTVAVDITKPGEHSYQGNASSVLNEIRSLSKDSDVTLVLSAGKRTRPIAAGS
jgi:16S rRNA (cytidine1402-2'-O)-methyltransferase